MLCELVCAIEPGIVKRISESPLPYKQMDNIAAFSSACKKLGVPERDCFDTIDLFEGKDIVAVVQTIHALGRTVQTTRDDLPKLGPRLATRNERHFTDAQLRRASASCLPAQTAGATIERQRADQSNSVCWGHAQSGAGATAAASAQTAGATIARLPVDQSYGCTWRNAPAPASPPRHGAPPPARPPSSPPPPKVSRLEGVDSYVSMAPSPRRADPTPPPPPPPPLELPGPSKAPPSPRGSPRAAPRPDRSRADSRGSDGSRGDEQSTSTPPPARPALTAEEVAENRKDHITTKVSNQKFDHSTGVEVSLDELGEILSQRSRDAERLAHENGA